MIAQEQVKGWEYLYDKYSSSIYGVIYLLSRIEIIAEDIFFDLFVHLKNEREILITHKAMLCHFLMQETFTFAINEIKSKGLEPHKNGMEDKPKLLKLLCAKYCLGCGEASDGDGVKKIPV
ncbi:MAG: hypothetical protein ABI261_02765 [Ginsengibacter sp.]